MNETNTISLAGTWSCQLDPNDVGAVEGWASQELTESVVLPGSLDEAGLGTPNPDPAWLGGLSRKVTYTGPAWYSRLVDLPAVDAESSLTLRLERTHWFASVFVNGEALAEQDSLSIAQEWDLTPWAGQTNVRLTLHIDNTPKIPIGRIGHALTDWTQTNWNGVIGEIALQVRPRNGIRDIVVVSTPDGLRVTCVVPPNVTVEASHSDTMVQVRSDAQGKANLLLPASVLPRWSDTVPQCVTVQLRAAGETLSVTTGYRTLDVQGRHIRLNGDPLFLRGTLECCIFPKTGYPPMTIEPWQQIMAKAQEYGLNHLRFHSWCPPEAAFHAADAAGVVLQVELPLWTGTWALSSDASLLAFCRREAFRILRTYSHHPSFLLFTLGNEMSFYGQEPEVEQLLTDLKEAFPHILFNFSAHGTYLSEVCDYYVQADNGKPGAENRPLRGSTWFGVGSRFDRESPSSVTTCNEAADQFTRPVISHEVAEWAVFPDVDNVARYDGVLEARNFAHIRTQLQERGMAAQAAQFTFASGKLSALLYKEEIETLLRTRNLSGYQLLGLTDFPGQGTATIGMLDAFWQEKGFITGEAFREFCAPTVPLMAAEKFVWTTDEVFTAEMLAFHSGKPTTTGADWVLTNDAGQTLASGTLARKTLVAGGTVSFGSITLPLTGFDAPQRLELCVALPGLGKNRWKLWVYPPLLAMPELPEVAVFSWYREDVRQALKQGKTVWLKSHPSRLWPGIPGRFAPAFWSPIHFKEQVGTMGTVIQKDHPLFAAFPTEAYTEWQWWEILTRSKARVLNDLPLSFRPQLQVIDRYERNFKLGTIFEARVGNGRLLSTLIDFETPGRPAARQLEFSLRQHLAAADFVPEQTVTMEQLNAIHREDP